ncbi:hypothetical protein [Streptococcus ruminantium]|uniref:hypothetical protein n=1 Tax=Streptococcus ruminantium TaxID=1917441 RepID=UPI0012DD982D|nr:hypothetical protein [Streptococcus ruminantium]BDD42843.1 hypothetical protein GUT189_11760 [Streptococcus ruminantium]
MIKIKEIEWLDEESDEAVLVLVDSHQKELVCFTHSIPIEKVEKRIYTLYPDFCTEPNISDLEMYVLTHIDNFVHFVVGQVIDTQRPLIKCFDYIFDLEVPIGEHISNGDWIEFEVGRFNVR